MKKVCSKCKIEKQLAEFCKSKNGKLGAHHYCKSCLSIQKKNGYDYLKSKNIALKRYYNLTLQEVENLFTNQNKKCKICNIEYLTVSKSGGLYIDHCHNTKKVRGLICIKCNSLLGNCNDNISILKSAINYLSN